jgi:iron complex transport system substrate-binding protein
MVPAITEFVYSMRADQLLIGTSSFCNYPKEAQEKPRLGGYLNPNLERIVSLRPTHLIVMQSQPEVINRFNRLGVESVAVKTDSLADVFTSVRQVADVLGTRAVADRLIAGLESELREIRQEAGTTGNRVAVIVGREPQSLKGMYAAGPGTYLGEITAIAGGQNVVPEDTQPYPMVTKEQIVKWNPTVIIDTSLGESPAGGMSAWDQLPVVDAVKSRRVHIINDSHMTIPGPHLAVSARTLRSLITATDGSTSAAAQKTNK